MKHVRKCLKCKCGASFSTYSSQRDVCHICVPKGHFRAPKPTQPAEQTQRAA